MENLPENLIEIDSEDIINFLKSKIQLKEIYHQLLRQKVIQKAAYSRGIFVTTDEIELEANFQRREKGLEKAVDTVNWLSEELVSFHDWEVGIRNLILSQKLATALFAPEVEKFFRQNRSDFEQVILYQFTVENEKLARELYFEIEEGEITFFEAARIYDINLTRRLKCGYEGQIYRWALPVDIASVIFSTTPQQLIGPLKTDQGFNLYMIEDLIPAELTPQRYKEILDNMFQQWLRSEVDYILFQRQ